MEDFPKVFKDASFLCDQGADPTALNTVLNLTNERAAEFKGYVFSHYHKTKEGVLYLRLSYKQLKRFHLSPNAASSYVNLLSNIQGYPIWVFFCENEDGSLHIEFRSNGPAVQPIAVKYGGGGHALAAGVTIVNPTDEIIANIIEDLNNLIRTH